MYFGIDLGTSGVKVLLLDGDQKIVGSASADISLSRPHAGWSEQDPAEWISATETAIAELKAAQGAAFGAIKSIGLSGHMHGATMIDAEDKVIRPCMLWNDVRSYEEAAALDGNPDFRKISGNIVFPGFTAPKVSWVAKNEPENFAKIAKVLLPKDYLRLWLTGDYVSEPSDAAGTSWFDVGARDWSSTLLDAAGMRRDQMPDIVEGSEASGILRAELASAWGLGINVIVAGGAGDNAASAIGMGTVAPNSAFLSLGTSGVLFATNDAYRPNPESAVHAFCHAIPDTWHQMGVILSATDALNWYSNLVGKTPQELTAELGDTLKAPSGATFLPYLSGERTPHNDAQVRGFFAGLAHDHDRVALTQSVMEGVGFAFRDCLNALSSAGTSVSRVTAVGGGSKSLYWLKIMATVLDIEVDIPADGDFGAAFGAARLAILAETKSDPLTVCTPPVTEQTIGPDAQLKPAFDEAYETYTSLYPAMKGLL